MRASKLNLGILLLPATSAYDLRGYAHHLHPRSFAPSGGTVAPSGGTAPYGLGNGTSTFGSSGLLATAGMSTRTSQVHVTVPGGTVYHTVSASGVHEPYGSSAATGVGSSCTQATVTHRVNTTFYVTEYGSGGASINTPSSSSSAASPAAVTSSPPVVTLTPSVEPSSSTADEEEDGTAVAPSMTPVVASSSTSSTPVAPVMASSATSSIPAAPVAASPTTSVQAASENQATPDGNGWPKNSLGQFTKRGILASGNDTDELTAAFANSKVSWMGNWYHGPPPNLTPEMHLEFVPQVYNDEYAEAEGWASNSEKAIAAGVEYFMYFGEPKAEGISVERAVDVWMDKFEPYSKRGVKLGAPGNLQNDGDFEWQEEFLKQCAARGCTIDFVCVHWMWSAEQIESFKEVITRATTLAGKYGNKQVWVDNFFAEGTYDAQIAFLKEAIPWLETNPKIDRYAYVGLDRPLKDKEGRDSGGFFPPDENSYELTELGRFYASYEG